MGKFKGMRMRILKVVGTGNVGGLKVLGTVDVGGLSNFNRKRSGIGHGNVSKRRSVNGW